MNLQDYQSEYERLLRWREAWGRLSSKFEPGRLQSRQDAIEEKAYQANRRIGGLINKFDKQQNENATHYSKLPTKPALCGAKKSVRYPLVTTSNADLVTCIGCVNLLVLKDCPNGCNQDKQKLNDDYCAICDEKLETCGSDKRCCPHDDGEHVSRYCMIPDCGCRNFRETNDPSQIAHDILSPVIGKVRPEIYTNMVEAVAIKYEELKRQCQILRNLNTTLNQADRIKLQRIHDLELKINEPERDAETTTIR